MKINTNPYRERTSTKMYCKTASLSKMIIYPKEAGATVMTRYSRLDKDKKGKFAGLKSLVELAFSPKYINTWRTLLIYDNQTGHLAEKYVNGKQIAI